MCDDALFEPAVLSDADAGNISQRKWYAFGTATRDTFMTSKSKTSKAIHSRLKALNDSVSSPHEPIINIAIAARSIDALCSNALSWSCARTVYPKLAFTVMHLHPSDSNRDHLEPHPATQDIQWNVYDVELLAHLYPPLLHEETLSLKPTTTTRIWSEHAIAIHEKFLVLQQEHERVAMLQGRTDLQRKWTFVVTERARLLS